MIDNYVALFLKIRLYSRQPPGIQAATPDVTEIEDPSRNLRGKVSKHVYVLALPECGECDDSPIEAFPHEHSNLLRNMPLFCEHQKKITSITALGLKVERFIVLPITIPA